MRILNIVLVIVSILVLIGLFYTGIKDKNPEPVTTGSIITDVLSADKSILKVENGIIYILEGTLQEDILNNIISGDSSSQTYRITTNEGFNKSFDIVYEDDRLYVTAENGINETYYTIMYTDSLD